MAKKKAPRRSRGLVLGHLERISSAAFDAHSKIITELVGGTNGIYALYRNTRLYYVGLATNLKRRVNQHLKDRHAGKWNYFSLYLIRSERHLKDLETLAIHVAYPRGNATRSRFVGALDLRPTLKKKMKQQAIAEITKVMGRDGQLSARKDRKKARRGAAARKAWATRKAARKAPLEGLLADKRLRGTYKGKDYVAWVYRTGRIKLEDTGKLYDSPSSAARAIKNRPANGWRFWRYLNEQEQWRPLAELRK